MSTYKKSYKVSEDVKARIIANLVKGLITGDYEIRHLDSDPEKCFTVWYRRKKIFGYRELVDGTINIYRCDNA